MTSFLNLKYQNYDEYYKANTAFTQHPRCVSEYASNTKFKKKIYINIEKYKS